MKVPMSVADFLYRAEHVHGARIGVHDEPDPPGGGLGDITYARMGELARAQAAALDDMGIATGERVAIVSQNSARLLTSFFGVSAFGRILVPINFRLNVEEIRYIIDHSGASLLLVDPELADSLADIDVKKRIVLGHATDGELYREGVEPEPWAPDEDATATINYTSGTTARPKGVQITHRNIWTNAVTFGWHAGVSERDVYLHTLPMFHANGWGMPFALTGMGVPQVVLRKVDGVDILRRTAG
jgi:fatty-acyl-CoA synthase